MFSANRNPNTGRPWGCPAAAQTMLGSQPRENHHPNLAAARRGTGPADAAACRGGPGKGAQPLHRAALPDRRGAVRQLHQADRHQDQPHRRPGRPAAGAHPQRRRQQPGGRVHHGGYRAPVARPAGRRVRAGEVEGAGVAHPGQLPRSQWRVVRLLGTRPRDRLQQGRGQGRRHCQL